MKGRIAALDGLRGIAILMVLLFHSNVLFGGEFSGGRARIVSLLMGGGWTGVDLFFVLSGFLITGLLLEAKGHGRPGEYFGGFYLRRALRILPLYYGFLAIFAVLPHCALLDTNHYKPTAGDWRALGLFYYNLYCVWSSHVVPNLHQFWSLSVEEHFYLLWPLIVWKCSDRSVMRLCAALILVSLASRVFVVANGYPLQAAYLITICRFDGLALGALLAVANRDRTNWLKVEKAAVPSAIGASLVVLAVALWQGHFKDVLDFRFPHDPVRHDSKLSLTIGITAATWLYGTALVGAIRPGRLARFLSFGPLASIGKYSFAMYVFHRILLRASDYLGRTWIPRYQDFNPALAKPLFAVWLTAVSYAAAWVSFRFYESRFLKLGRRNRPALIIPTPSAG